MLSAYQSGTSAHVDVEAVMRDIRMRIRGSGNEQAWIRQGKKAVPSNLISSIARLRASTALLRSAVARIGEPPPAPPTLRGRLGMTLVRVIRRALFWLIPSIANSQSQIIDALEGQLTATEEILRILQQTHIEIARLASISVGGSESLPRNQRS